MGTWIDFKSLRQKLDFEKVLRHYQVEVKRKGDQHHGYCPLPNHNGKKNSPSFSANLTKGIFNCFGCGAKGNVLEFAAIMEGVSVNDGVELRTVAIKLRDKFCPEFGNARRPANKKETKNPAFQAEQRELPEVAKETTPSKVIINAPLDFELKRLDPDHPYLEKRGFTKATINHFGLGFCPTGLLAGRIAIPLHDYASKLIGYAGRIVDDALINEENPKYKFPGQREHKGVVYEFHKMHLLYNVHRLKFPVETLVIVEGFPSVWWLSQMEIPNVVAVMGASCSEEQGRLILDLVPPNGRVWVIPDGNDAGQRCALSVFEQVATSRFLQWLKLDGGKQPTDYPGGWFRKQFER